MQLFCFLAIDDLWPSLVWRLRCSPKSIQSLIKCMFKTRVSEPEPGASYKNRRLRNPETPCRYNIARDNESIYFLNITKRNITKKFIHESTIFWALGAAEPAQNRRLRNPSSFDTLQYYLLLFMHFYQNQFSYFLH